MTDSSAIIIIIIGSRRIIYNVKQRFSTIFDLSTTSPIISVGSKREWGEVER